LIQKKKLKEATQNNIIDIFNDEDNSLQTKNDFTFTQSLNNTTKKITHYCLANLSYKNHNKKVIDELKSRINFTEKTNKFIRTSFDTLPIDKKKEKNRKQLLYLDSIKMAIKKTLFKYYTDINEDIIIDNDNIGTCSRFFLTTRPTIGQRNSLKIQKRDDNFMSNIWKMSSLEYKSLYGSTFVYLFLECPGIDISTIKIDSFPGDDSLICISLRKIDYIANINKDNLFSKKNEEKDIADFEKI